MNNAAHNQINNRLRLALIEWLEFNTPNMTVDYYSNYSLSDLLATVEKVDADKVIELSLQA